MLRKMLTGLAVLTVAVPLAAQEGQPNWDGLVKVEAKKLDEVYLLPQADFRDYTKVMIDPTADVRLGVAPGVDELYALTNERPVARADSATTMNRAPVTVKVLTNDTDADGTLAPQSVRLVTNPSHGTVVLNANGSIVYKAAAKFSGTDTFSYTVTDNQGATSNAAVVTVKVK